MPIKEMEPFTPAVPDTTVVFNVGEIPEELDVFYRAEHDFLPEGKDFSELTKEEMDELRSRHRFSPFKPGIYQGITGLGGMY